MRGGSLFIIMSTRQTLILQGRSLPIPWDWCLSHILREVDAYLLHHEADTHLVSSTRQIHIAHSANHVASPFSFEEVAPYPLYIHMCSAALILLLFCITAHPRGCWFPSLRHPLCRDLVSLLETNPEIMIPSLVWPFAPRGLDSLLGVPWGSFSLFQCVWLRSPLYLRGTSYPLYKTPFVSRSCSPNRDVSWGTLLKMLVTLFIRHPL